MVVQTAGFWTWMFCKVPGVFACVYKYSQIEFAK